MRLVVLALILGCCTILSGCRRLRSSPPPPPPAKMDDMTAGLVITKGGSWASPESHNYRNFGARVGTEVEWLYQWSLPGDRGSTRDTLALSSPSVPWFVYVESRTRLWFFDGEKNLTYRRWENSEQSGDAIINGVLKIPAAEVPAGLVPNLPLALQKLFPAGAKPRPSI